MMEINITATRTITKDYELFSQKMTLISPRLMSENKLLVNSLSNFS